MKTSAFSQAGLLFIGGTVVFLIGALVKFDPESSAAKTPVATPMAAPPDVADDPLDAVAELPLPANFPASLAQVVKLTRAGLREDVVLAYVQNSGEHYAPTADEMIYLHRAGVAETVMAALVKQKPTLPAAIVAARADTAELPTARETAQDEGGPRVPLPSTPAPSLVALETPLPPARPPAEDKASYFFDDLAPYGDWVETPENGWVWQPTVVQAIPDWRPYRDDGQWQFTDSGWYWQSTYAWGWAPFHYGRWAEDASRGWVWKPGSRWSPAWVAWRATSSHFGWAPLPPGVSLNVEYMLTNPGQSDFGLTASSFTFVPAAHFLSHNLAKYAASTTKSTSLLASSAAPPKSHSGGIPPDVVAAAVHTTITPIILRDAAEPTSRGPGISSHDLAVYRPNVPESSRSSNSTKSSK